MTKITETAERERRYETDVRSDSDYDELPSKARFVIAEADAHEIIRLSVLVAANGLHKVEKFDYRTSWLEGDDPDSFTEACSDADSLNVSENEFWFAGYLKHTNVEVLSERQRVSELKEWLGVQDIAKQTAAITPRVLVVVSGGIADPVSDAGVNVEVFDWDNYKDDPKGTGGVPTHFADLADPIGVPVGDAPRSTNRPKP
jgi:hypothetical protein